MPESEIDTGDNTNKGNFPGGMMMKGKTKLRGKKKGKGGEISISGSSGNGPIDFTKKKGYEFQKYRSCR